MKLFTATFSSPMYPEDNRLIGTYSDSDRAEEVIQSMIDLDKKVHANYPRRYQQKRDYYDVVEHELNEIIL